jgi:hypothetical protein
MSAKLEDIGIRTYVTGVLKTDEKTSADELTQHQSIFDDHPESRF